MAKHTIKQKLKPPAVFVLILMFAMLASALSAGVVIAQDSCSTVENVEYTGTLFEVPSGTYNVYARLAYRNQSALASVRIGDDSVGGCTGIGSAELTGDAWTRIGVWSEEVDTEALVLRMSSSAFSEIPGASRPSVVLMSTRQAPCSFTGIECRVVVEGRGGTLLMAGNLVDQESLHVSRPVSVEGDKIVKATYYIDDSPVYSKKELQPFDARYAYSSEQKASVTVEYASGQRVVLSDRLPDNQIATPASLLFRLYHANAVLFSVLIVLFGVAVIALIAWAVSRTLAARYMWRVAYGLTGAISYRRDTEEQRQRDARVRQLGLWPCRYAVSMVIAVGLFGMVWVVNKYIITVFKVDGRSMESTYTDGKHMIVYKAPVSWERIAGRKYLPERGQVVVLKAEYGLVDSQSSALVDGHYIVKRIIGLPGDRVMMKGGVIIVQMRSGEFIYPDQDGAWSRTMHGSRDGAEIDIVLGRDDVFIAGDNRPASIDSRANGPLSVDRIEGVVLGQI